MSLSESMPLPFGPAAELPPVRTVKRGPNLRSNAKASQRNQAKVAGGQLKQRLSIDSEFEDSRTPSAKQSPAEHGKTSLAKLAFQWNVPFEDVRASGELFQQHADIQCSSGADVFRDGRMSAAALKQVICHLTEVSSLEELDDETVESALMVADKTGDGVLNFEEFAFWHWERAFSSYVALSKDDRECRSVALSLGIPVSEAEHCKHLFDKFDVSRNKYLDFDEFREFINSLLGSASRFDSTKNVGLPESRILHFWQLCDLKGRGHVEFTEFAQFYKTHFDPDSFNPGETFYGGIRKACMVSVDSQHWEDISRDKKKKHKPVED
jgi:Ca2+-binding EF-hand superfamily protein